MSNLHILATPKKSIYRYIYIYTYISDCKNVQIYKTTTITMYIYTTTVTLPFIIFFFHYPLSELLSLSLSLSLPLIQLLITTSENGDDMGSLVCWEDLESSLTKQSYWWIGSWGFVDLWVLG